MSEDEALALWQELRKAFNDVERNVLRVIELRAWEPLGYHSFAEAWNAQMRGVRLASTAAMHTVIYALVDSGLTTAEVIDSLDGYVSETGVERLIEQKEAGIPASAATSRRRPVAVPLSGGETWRRGGPAKRPSPPSILHLEVGEEELIRLADIAIARDLTFKAECLKAIRTHFRALERAQK